MVRVAVTAVPVAVAVAVAVSAMCVAMRCAVRALAVRPVNTNILRVTVMAAVMAVRRTVRPADPAVTASPVSTEAVEPVVRARVNLRSVVTGYFQVNAIAERHANSVIIKKMWRTAATTCVVAASADRTVSTDIRRSQKLMLCRQFRTEEAAAVAVAVAAVARAVEAAAVAETAEVADTSLSAHTTSHLKPSSTLYTFTHTHTDMHQFVLTVFRFLCF